MVETFMAGKYPCECSDGSCLKIGSACVDVSVPVEVKPEVAIGKIETKCDGTPTIDCEECCGEGCVIKITQRICIRVPIQYGVKTSVGEKTISCEAGT